MTPSTETPEYLLLFRNTNWHDDLLPDEIKRVMTDWMAWFDGLVADGRCRGGQSLTAAGHIVSGASRTVTDGPYAEARESVAGYFVLTVPSFDAAIAIAKLCPGLPYGCTVEVRELLPRCAASELSLSARTAVC